MDVTLFRADKGLLETRVISQALQGDEVLALEGGTVVMMRQRGLYTLTLSSA